MDAATLETLKAAASNLKGILVEIHGITATGADGPIGEHHGILVEAEGKLNDGLQLINGITATGAD